MFCKWCGKTILATDERCTACGRQTPAMSDCGGLYNLKHSATAPTPPVPTPSKHPLIDRLEAQYEKDRRAARKHHTATIAGFTVTIIVLLVLLVSVVMLTIQISKLEDKMDAFGETSAAQKTEPMTPTDPDAETFSDSTESPDPTGAAEST